MNKTLFVVALALGLVVLGLAFASVTETEVPTVTIQQAHALTVCPPGYHWNDDRQGCVES